MERFEYFPALREIFKGTLLILCIYATTDYAYPKEWADLANKLAGGNHIYFTRLSLYMTIMTLVLSYCVKYFGVSSIREVYRDSLSIALPMEGLVTTVFWILNTIDPTLLKDRELYMAGVRTPLVSELSLHLLPLVLLLIDQVGVNIYERKRHYWVFGFFGVIYFGIIHHFQRINNSWVYPFLGYVLLPMRIILAAVATLLVMVYYRFFVGLSRFINARTYPEGRRTKLL
ncbi:hypothetical protein [Encephalitozoon cuniculi GB-M1]|uniref:FAR-17a/AIG1-like protein n=2 Tax=Encephalitozoon cuniculi TaxID=6035 RepID=Q8SW25_ENCCU|nr:uncharacterized protein ECU03_1050 [Encephalitozoon cuniculi GB-M1]AGE95960.1 hypothetical protein ECU03_1050 [Encephalitozoon cuniculi]KMV66467.1 hypothetical protein M970_030970 [Encephalitozoon cuniculi EcunIII-L]UYI28095.1 FAR-17a/AIG1-like protein [Encephalitozoon cuniculi]CAD26249.1 hypothetical protein [Encephalitozoon cuniculi GB-M1]